MSGSGRCVECFRINLIGKYEIADNWTIRNVTLYLKVPLSKNNCGHPHQSQRSSFKRPEDHTTKCLLTIVTSNWTRFLARRASKLKGLVTDPDLWPWKCWKYSPDFQSYSHSPLKTQRFGETTQACQAKGANKPLEHPANTLVGFLLDSLFARMAPQSSIKTGSTL